MKNQSAFAELSKIDPMRLIISFVQAGVISLLYKYLFNFDVSLVEQIVIGVTCFAALWLILSIAALIGDAVIKPEIDAFSFKRNKRLTFDYFIDKSNEYENDKNKRDRFLSSCINQYVEWEGLINNVDKLSDYEFAIIIRNAKHPQSLAKANISAGYKDKYPSKLEMDRKIRLRAHLRLDFEIPYLYNAKIMKIT